MTDLRSGLLCVLTGDTIMQLSCRMWLVWEHSKGLKSLFPSPQLQLFPFCPLYKGFPRGIVAHIILDTRDTKDRNRQTSP